LRRLLSFGFPVSVLIGVVGAIGAALIALSGAVPRGPTYWFCGLLVLLSVLAWVFEYRKAGGHLKLDVWKLHRDLEVFANERADPPAITADEQLRADGFWATTRSSYAQDFRPRVDDLRTALRKHRWLDEELWSGRALIDPRSVDDIRTMAEALRATSLNLP
jgi:hypothetical protein